jgi:hypothetical protein
MLTVLKYPKSNIIFDKIIPKVDHRVKYLYEGLIVGYIKSFIGRNT